MYAWDNILLLYIPTSKQQFHKKKNKNSLSAIHDLTLPPLAASCDILKFMALPLCKFGPYLFA